MRHDDSNDNPTPQPERFDEFTGGYDDVDHARAAKRLSADLRAMDATPRAGQVRDLLEAMRKADSKAVYANNRLASNGTKEEVYQALSELRDLLCDAIERATR